MAELPDKKKIVVWILIGFSIYTIWMLNNAERLADIMFNSSVPVGLVLYTLTNPAYVLIIAGIMWSHKDKLFKSFIAGVSFTVALDIISIPRLPSVVPTAASGALDFGKLALDNVLLVNSDFIIAKAAVGAGISYSTFWNFYYFIFPIGLFLLTAHLLGYAKFLKRLKGDSS